MKIPFAKPLISEKERSFISKVIKSPILTHGENLKNLNNDFKKKFNFIYGHGVSSCTAALHLSFMAINLKKGDEVIVPNQTHVSTVHTFQILGQNQYLSTQITLTVILIQAKLRKNYKKD